MDFWPMWPILIAIYLRVCTEAHPGRPSLKSCGREPRNRRRSGHQRDEVQIHGYLHAGCMIAGLGGLYYVMDYASGVWSNDAFGDAAGWRSPSSSSRSGGRSCIIFASIFFGGLYILYLYCRPEWIIWSFRSYIK